jgi:hypothetical protein
VVEHPSLIGVRDERESFRGHGRIVAWPTDTSRAGTFLGPASSKATMNLLGGGALRLALATTAVAAVMLVACSPQTPVSPRGGGQNRPGIATGPLLFVLDDRYQAGESVRVRLQNLSEDTFLYNSEYQACEMTYKKDGASRPFLIPPGTHCDLVLIQEIRPDQTVTLFTWDLDECVKDDWGCVKSKPLASGTYTIAGEFERKGGGDPVEVQGTFEIVAE